MEDQKFTKEAIEAKRKLKEYQDRINPLIEDYFDKKHAEYEKAYPEHIVYALDVYRDIATRDCKRLRASFVYYVYKMFNGGNDLTAIKLGAAIEFVQAYLLLLDDFMDMSDQRRHGPTAHMMFKNYYEKKGFVGGDSQHYGNSIAVTLGAMGFHLAMQIINDLDLEPSIIKQLSNNLNSEIEITAVGQIIDVTNVLAPNVSEQDVLDMLKYKTGVYTYENPIQSGAIMAGFGDETTLKNLSEFAIPGGIAFQVQDDILGMFGESDSTGKSNMDDLMEGKYTLLIHKALEDGDDEQKKIIKDRLGRQDITQEDHKLVQQVIIDTGSLEYSKTKAKELTKQAQNSLKKNKEDSWSNEGFDYLIGIADYVIARDK